MKAWFAVALLAEAVALFFYISDRAGFLGVGLLQAFASGSLVVIALYVASRSGSAEREEDAAGPGEAP